MRPCRPNTLPKSKPKTAAAMPPATNRRASGQRASQREAGGGDDESLADVAEHVAEHQRARRRPAARSDRPRCASGIPSARLKISNGRAQRGIRRAAAGAFARRRRRRKVQQRARPSARALCARRCAGEIAGPAGDPAEEFARLERVHVLDHPLQPSASPSAARRSCVAERSSSIRDESRLLAVERRQTRRDVAFGLAGVDLEPRAACRIHAP